MLRSLRVQNFKCLKDVTVDLKSLTVLIGKNDTGKSSFLEAVSTLGQLVAGDVSDFSGPRPFDQVAWRDTAAATTTIAWSAQLEPNASNGLTDVATYELGIGAAPKARVISVDSEKLTFGTRPDVSIERTTDVVGRLQVALKESTASYSHQVASMETGLSMAPRHRDLPLLNAVARALASTTRYRLDPAALAVRSEFLLDTERPDAVPRLLPNGYGLPSVLDYLLGAHRSVFDAIQRDLSAAVPHIKSILLNPWREDTRVNGHISSKSGKALGFQLATDGIAVSASLASDGVLLFLAYLTLVHAPNPPAIILLEEPENGVHPHQLKRIAGYLKLLSDPARGAAAAQVIVATHSPYLLDFVDPEWVVVFGRRKSGETVTTPLLTVPGVQERLDSGLSVGELWFNMGEDRLLEGVTGEAPSGQ